MTRPQDRSEDLVDVLIHDHRELEELFGEVDTEPGAARRRSLANAIVAELVRHTVAEEQYLYPLMRRVLPDGDRIAEHHIHDHAEAEADMKRLEGLEATDPDFEFVLRRLLTEMRQHFLEEEVEVFPPVRAATDPDDLRELGGKAQRAERFAPTRPHASAPAGSPVSKLLNPALGMVDRIRDALRRA